MGDEGWRCRSREDQSTQDPLISYQDMEANV
jgi:hypothetical protein